MEYMLLLVVSFLSGILTVLAPCILPLLPIIIGGSVGIDKKRSPLLIAISLAVSVVIFTLALKFSSIFINIPATVWSTVSGTIIIVFGIFSLFPGLWDRINVALGLGHRSDAALAAAAQKQNHWGDVLMGASLGPVFSSCSPTYFLILATVLPRSFAEGLVYLTAYAVGLSAILLLISYLGQRIIRRVRAVADPRGPFKRTLGAFFVLVGIFIMTGYDKRVQTWVLDHGFYKAGNLEERLLENIEQPAPISDRVDTEPARVKTAPLYREVVAPDGFVNTNGITIGELVGKKVILVDFMTYSCINCIRTFPYLNAWYDKYRDQGFEIIGIHTPEFAFERKIDNVREAMARYGIKFPIVLDNDYGTWRAYGNNYWPRKYLIDIDGYIVYDHIGEGNYEETEMKIQELLAEAGRKTNGGLVAIPDQTPQGFDLSRETYLGSERMQYHFPESNLSSGEHMFVLPESVPRHSFAFGGEWSIDSEKATAKNNASLKYHFQASQVYVVLQPGQAHDKVKILLDGKPIDPKNAGADVKDGYVTMDADRLYHVADFGDTVEAHTLLIEFLMPGTQAFAFTFG